MKHYLLRFVTCDPKDGEQFYRCEAENEAHAHEQLMFAMQDEGVESNEHFSEIIKTSL